MDPPDKVKEWACCDASAMKNTTKALHAIIREDFLHISALVDEYYNWENIVG